MRTLSVLLLSAGLVLAQPNRLTPQEVADGWILLFDGETTFGWTAEGGAVWKVADGALAADGSAAGWLRTNSEFADFVLKAEFRTAADGNSGIFLRSARQGAPHETGYELQIFDHQPAGFHTGSLVNHLKAKKPVKIKDNQWMSYEVEVQGNHFLVKLDGETVLYGRDNKSRVGHIGLQINKEKPVQFRNLKLRPLGLQPLFNGKNLKGWLEVDAPKPKEKPVWTVTNGRIHVEKGPGQLESERAFQDFVLQLDIRTNPQSPDHHPNSGVFFRGLPKTFWSGYEAQIRNEFKNNDRTQPHDFGTGGLYHYQPARRVVPNDGEFFTMTVLARGRHLATWVNGYPTADWEDTRPEGTNARKEAVTLPGVFSLQAHDPTTNLDFKNLRVAELPKGN